MMNIKSKEKTTANTTNLNSYLDLSSLSTIKPSFSSDIKHRSPLYDHFISFINGKPLRLFFLDNTNEMINIIAADNDVNIAKTLMDSGLDNFPVIKTYLVNRVLEGIETKPSRQAKIDVLKVLNARTLLIEKVNKKPNLIYSSIIEQL